MVRSVEEWVSTEEEISLKRKKNVYKHALQRKKK